MEFYLNVKRKRLLMAYSKKESEREKKMKSHRKNDPKFYLKYHYDLESNLILTSAYLPPSPEKKNKIIPRKKNEFAINTTVMWMITIA